MSTPLNPPQVNADQLRATLAKQQSAYLSQGIPTLAQRQHTLDTLKSLIMANQQAIVDAICKDYGHRAHQETRLAEIFPSIDGINHARKKLSKWMKTQKRSVGIWALGARNTVIPQPLGVVGIVVPWNYPLFLCISPLVCAIAAGNRCMIKMAANSSNLCHLLQALFAETFAEDMITIIPGAKGSDFSALPFDHLVFTGSGSTGRQVMRAAANNLTPVTLELGGKSPAIIAPDYPITKAAERLLFFKCLNAGQTCVAPDYLFVPEGKVNEFVAAAKRIVNTRYPNISSPDYTSVIDEAAYQRLNSTLADASALGAQAIPMVMGDTHDDTMRKLAPTLLTDVNDNMRVMQEEVFGPLLPIMTYTHMNDVLDYVNRHARPLGLYLFSHDKQLQTDVINKTRSGGVCINDTTLQVSQHDLPFGGVGESGMGHYHGMEGFMTMSKLRPIFKQARKSTLSNLYPPYGARVNAFLKVFVR
ncbi:MAG: coniferyl aldehyde dehydrogenase [Oceanospirillaceae bacterium]|jgi:coniferyl-aldehyde dehydrogenase|nr:coniferyl aldehyde dehydrogenase [Oceanospirillaceae bacterium]MBT4442105.1 coniferyl aldehyde dehydrogenase [Oceanospirillaceae bacterium]MBT6076997.1 coniferyl aldehyde dehydrogenase [Oceanospirillaceae bacterium]